MYLSLKTVKSHTQANYRELGASSRPEAIEQAHLGGLVWHVLFATRELVIKTGVFHPGEKHFWVRQSHPGML
jgi:hypothetical protein